MNKRLDKIEDIEQMIKEEESKQRGITLYANGIKITLSPAKKGKSFKLQILEHSRKNYYEGGIFNEKRNCYYPKNIKFNKNVDEYNKMEKLFKKWEFSYVGNYKFSS